jgi:hypothetical protein
MNKLDSHLNPTMKNPYHPVIQAAMKLACKKINHYYLMMDLLLAYQIVMAFVSYPTAILTSVFSPSPGSQARILLIAGLGRRMGR